MYREGLHFVGDWHTHPQRTPEPSQKDIDSILDCYRESRKGIRGFLLVIVGLNAFPTGLYVGLADAAHLHPLAFMEGDASCIEMLE
jgi:proteasome lid subunit RPN8/RPN11